MSIPPNISAEHIGKAIEEIKKSEIPSERLSYHYFLKEGDKELPPKYVISIANKYANNIELPSSEFNAVEAKKFLESLGFSIIVKKTSFFSQILKFLDQTKTTNLQYSQYIKEYLGLKVRVSFGKGNIARIPWISFLGKDQTTEKGIYPGYLYYKEYDELILSYCVSETNPSEIQWRKLNNMIKIGDYFKNQGKKAVRYGDSFIFKVYNLKHQLDQNQMDEDLIELINRYKAILSDNLIQTKLGYDILNTQDIQNKLMKIETSAFSNDIKAIGLSIDSQLINRYVASIISKPFTILTGLSGSGKTKLAQVFAKWLCENESQYKLIPVGADWTNREPLLGYPNALETGKYVLPENGALNLILEAAKEGNQNKPYFLILDEMNLSHVERYFADFLSTMESDEDIPLRPESANWEDDIPAKIKLPKNLFIVGTVNIDETTYMFSPKVLDRANVIEFRVSETEMEQFLKDIQPLNLDSINGVGANMAASFVELAKNKDLKPIHIGNLNTTLISFFNELKKTGAEFGYRSASEIHRFVAVANQLDPACEMNVIIDCAIMQKLLPKVHGSRRKLEPVLRTLGSLCLADGKTIEEIFNRKSDIDFNDPAVSKYPLSLEKIDRMYKGLMDNGFTSYAEA